MSQAPKRYLLNARLGKDNDIYSVSSTSADKVLQFLRHLEDPEKHLTLVPFPDGQPIHDLEVYDYLKGRTSADLAIVAAIEAEQRVGQETI